MNGLRTVSLAVLAAILAGCQPESGKPDQVGKTDMLGPQYSEKNGLLVSDDTRASLGVMIVDVTEGSVTADLELALRVYQVTADASLASGMVTPEQAEQLASGVPVLIDNGDEGILTGSISALREGLREATGMIEILVELPGSSAAPAVGAFLQGTVKLKARDGVVTVPRSALLQCSDGFSVYTVSGEHLVRTAVKVGAANDERAEIEDGLYAGDQVVAQAAMSLWMTELAAVKADRPAAPRHRRASST